MHGKQSPSYFQSLQTQQYATVDVCRGLPAFNDCFVFIGTGDRIQGLEPTGQCFFISELCPQFMATTEPGSQQSTDCSRFLLNSHPKGLALKTPLKFSICC